MCSFLSLLWETKIIWRVLLGKMNGFVSRIKRKGRSGEADGAQVIAVGCSGQGGISAEVNSELSSGGLAWLYLSMGCIYYL